MSFEVPVEGGVLRGHRTGSGAPALLLHGGPAVPDHMEQDPLPLRSATETAALIPGAVVEAVPDCGHYPWLEQPQAFRAAVDRLMNVQVDAHEQQRP